MRRTGQAAAQHPRLHRYKNRGPAIKGRSGASNAQKRNDFLSGTRSGRNAGDAVRPMMGLPVRIGVPLITRPYSLVGKPPRKIVQ